MINKFSRKKIIFFLSLTFMALTIYLLFVLSLPDNPMTFDNKFSKISIVLFPEGWNFFTKDPKENTFDIYMVKGNNLEKVTRENSAYLFGISRRGRFYSIQLGQILSKNKIDKWDDFYGNLNSYKDSSWVGCETVKNSEFDSYIKEGNYLLVENINLPWVWVAKSKKYRKKYKVVKICLIKS